MLDAFQYVEFVVETAVAVFVSGLLGYKRVQGSLLVLVENLHPHESIENQSPQLLLLMLGGISEDLLSSEIERECDHDLEDCLSNDHLPHVEGDQWC